MRKRLSKKRHRKTRHKDRRKTNIQRKNFRKTYLELFPKRSRKGCQVSPGSSQLRQSMSGIKLLHHVISQRQTTRSKKRRGRSRPRRRRHDQGNRLGATANPSDEPAAMATVTSGVSKSAIAYSVPLTATSTTVRSEP